MDFEDIDANKQTIQLKSSEKKLKKSNSKDTLLTSPLIDNEVVPPASFAGLQATSPVNL